MGIGVGIARIQYLSRPTNCTVYGFMRYLVHNRYDADWELSAEGNLLAEYSRPTMRRMVDRYAESRSLGSGDKDRVMDWAFGLSWNERTDTIMLHLWW